MTHIKSSLVSLTIAITSALFPLAVTAAEKITFSFPPLGQFNLEIEDLETFVSSGEISSELAYYLDRLSPEQAAKLPKLLSTPLELDPVVITKFSNSDVGEILIKNFGKAIKADDRRNGFYGLRGAIIAAAFDKEGLSIINLLHRFPSKTIYLDLQVLTQYLERARTLAQNRQTIYQTWFSDNEYPNSNDDRVKSNQKKDLSLPGQYLWKQQTISYQNPYRVEPGYFNLYQPLTKQPAPLIVVSHGMASNRQTFAYLGEHLASYGFAVAVIEHNDISLASFDRFLSGASKFPGPNNLIYQPLDIKYVLDRLEQESQVNMQQVGIIGQSLGGYTSLAVGGGVLANEAVTGCEPEDYQNVLLDLSALAQCSLNQTDRTPIKLRDPRIKAVIAINPMSKVFGRAGMSSIEVPTMLISGSNDLVMPPVTEQIKPFTWLDRDLEKYLVLVKPGTHYSFLQEGLGVLPIPDSLVGPSPTSAYPALKALSTAFFQVHVAQQPEYQTFLKQNYLARFANQAFELSIIRSLTESQLEEIFD